MSFIEKVVMASRQQNSLLCVGLDPEAGRFPTVLQKQSTAKAVVHFCQAIIEATARYVCAYKANLAFFEVLGPEGMYVFQEVLAAMPDHIPVIVDAKGGELDNTARNYAAAVFDVYGCDAVTVNAYLGYDSVAPFLAYHEKGVILLCRTSNPGARDFQDLLVYGEKGQVRPLYEVLAQHVQSWNKQAIVVLELGAAYHQVLRPIRPSG